MPEDPEVSQEAKGSYIAQAANGGHASIAVTHVYPSSASAPDQDRTRFLVRLRTRYRDLLTQSLHEARLLTLKLAGYPDAVVPPVQLLSASEKPPVPAGTSLLTFYEEAGHELLVLGEPGAGKSTLLLELALDLVKQAEQDDSLLLPVIIPLSSWARKRQPLEQWLVAQVTLFYKLPRRLATRWVQQERLLPLLDGLGEMPEQARPACIVALNAYHREHLHPLVITSRAAEYAAAASRERLSLHHAVVVQPLSLAQVDAYLAQCGEPGSTLHTALRENPTLQEIATTPLMLSILLLIYQDQPIQQYAQKAEELQQQIWTAFVERMTRRKGKNTRYPLEKTCLWLSWLAKMMRSHHDTIFLLESLQPDLLGTPEKNRYRWSWHVLIGLSSALFFGLIGCLFTGKELAFGTALFFGLAAARGFGPTQKIEPAEAVHFSWSRFLKLSPFTGLFFGLLGGLPTRSFFGLVTGLALGLVIGLIAALERTQLPRHHVVSPNEGMKRSFNNGIFFFLLVGLPTGLVTGMTLWLTSGGSFGLMEGISFLLVSGLVAGMFFGLHAVLQHFLLRFFLWRLRLFPFRAVSFLEDATARILLRRVGAGYSFFHRQLLDYFADLPEQS